jgi:hypothetical protein
MDAELREKLARACYAGDPLISGGRLKTWDDLPENSRVMYRQQADALAPIIAEVEAAARADERLAVAGMRRSVQEAVALIDEINKRATSRAFYGIGQVLHGKLATIRATLAIRAQKEPSA